jgi:hypothetical protein
MAFAYQCFRVSVARGALAVFALTAFPAQAETPPAAEPASEGGEVNASLGTTPPQGEPLGVATINAAGFGFFGPTLALELGSRLTGYAKVRGFSLGYLSHTMFVEEGSDSELRAGSWGAGLGGRYYFFDQKRFAGPYAGLSAEYLYVGFESEPRKQLYHNRFAVLGADAGYRWRFGSFLVGVGAMLGYAMVLGDECEVQPGSMYECNKEPAESSLYGEGILDAGFAF